MKNFVKEYQSFVTLLPLKNWSVLLILTNLILIVLVFFFKTSLPPTIPLFYGKPYGASQLADQGNLIFPPLFALGICIINITIDLFIKDKFLEKVLFGSMFASTTLSLITVTKIMLLVGNI